jgi:hypothetical protein
VIALAAAGLILFAVLVEVLFPIMSSVEASERLDRERKQERAAQAALRPTRSIEVGPRG